MSFELGFDFSLSSESKAEGGGGESVELIGVERDSQD